MRLQNEPVLVGGAVSGLSSAVIALLVGFEIVDWTPAQIGLVGAVVTAVIVLAAAVARHFSWGPISHDAEVQRAVVAAETTYQPEPAPAKKAAKKKAK